VVVDEVIEQLEAADASVCIAIDSLESRVGSKVSNLAESLTEAFKLAFTVTNSNEQVFKSVFRFVS